MDGILGGIGDFFGNIFGGGECASCGDNDSSGARAGLSARADNAKGAIHGGRGGGGLVESMIDDE